MYYYRATCNTCGFDGKYSDFLTNYDGFQNKYVSGCKKCGAHKGPYEMDVFDAILGKQPKFKVYIDEEYYYSVERNYIIYALSKGLKLSHREVRHRHTSDNYWRYEIWDYRHDCSKIVQYDHVQRLEREGVIERHSERYRRSSRSRNWSYYIYYTLTDASQIELIPCVRCKHFIRIYRKRNGVCDRKSGVCRRKDETCGLSEVVKND
jgi:hypothetical protein